MGGGGDYYSRDVTDNRYRSASTGVSSVAERDLSRSSVDKSLLPMNRPLTCTAKNPCVYIFDVTGSMDNLPRIIYDKWPGIVGQVVAREYLPDPEMSLSAVGDIRSDDAPLQMANFDALRNLDKHFKKIFFEKGGGGQSLESYEIAAYYYAYLCEIPKAENPICLITGDEGYREVIYGKDLEVHFGGKHENTNARKVFKDLKKKFKGNVFLIHRFHTGKIDDATIVRMWRDAIGDDRVILLPSGTAGDLAIGDITLGVYAIVSGARTLKQYIEDMGNRDLNLGEVVKYEPQTPERIRQVERALEPLKDFRPLKVSRPASAGKAKTAKPSKKKENWEL